MPYTIPQKMRGYVSRGWPCNVKGIDPNVLPYFRIRNELAVQEDYLIRDTHCVIVPTELQPKLIQLAHDMHQGIVRTKQRLHDLYW